MTSSLKIISMAITLFISPYSDCSDLPYYHTAPLRCVEAFLSGRDLDWYEVSYCESRFITEAYGDPSKGGSYGLFQIHRRAHESTLNRLGYSIGDMYDPYMNVEYAELLYSQYDDWTHWTCKPTNDLEWRCDDNNPRNRDGTNDLWHLKNNSTEACKDYE